jgi:hypothetical protein
MRIAPTIGPTNGREAVGRSRNRGETPGRGSGPWNRLALLLFGSSLRGLVPLLLRQLLVLCGSVLGGAGTLLRGPFPLQRRIARHVALPEPKAQKNARADKP